MSTVVYVSIGSSMFSGINPSEVREYLNIDDLVQNNSLDTVLVVYNFL